MDTQNSSVIDVPDLKLAKVGAKRDKKRGGAAWFGQRFATAAARGAASGAGAGGMSLGKILLILLASGGLSAGAWQMGNMLAGGSSAGGAAAPKVFADKGGPQKYDDLSGVIKGGDHAIPNSLGYVNNDGLTDEQRAAKKAAEDAAAAKAAADAQAKADADAKEKALADAKAASATPDPTAEAQSPASPKLGQGSRFGAMKSSFGGSGGGLSGGAGLSGGINRGFASMGGLDGNKAKAGALSAFRSPAKAAATRAAGPTRGKSNAKGFAKQQLDMANGLSRTAAATGKAETASAGAGTAFDNSGAQGSVISGPGLSNGTQTGPADTGGTTNPNSGGGPIGNGAACSDPNMEPGPDGVCNQVTQTPPGKDAAPYQGLINAALIMMGIVTVLSVIAAMLSDAQLTKWYATAICWMIAILGAAIAAIGVRIATMAHGDFMIGAIVTAVGGFIGVQAGMILAHATALIGAGTMQMADLAAPELLASCVGMLALGTAKSSMSHAAMQ